MSFEMARDFDEVLGVDISHHLIEAAQHMKQTGMCSYTLSVEGNIKEKRKTQLDPLILRSRCSFELGDACFLRLDIGTFDVVLAANILDRLPEPRHFIERCTQLVNPGGVFVLISPYSWMPEYTRQEKWLGGADSNSSTTFEFLMSFMCSHGFQLVKRIEMPYLMRDHSRKFQWGCSDGTVWKLDEDTKRE